MELKLERPLVVFDIESTGVNPMRDRIVELAVLKIMPDGTSQSTVRRVNPEMPIPPGAMMNASERSSMICLRSRMVLV